MAMAVGHRAWPLRTKISGAFRNLARTWHEPGRELEASGERLDGLRGDFGRQEGIWKPVGQPWRRLGSDLGRLGGVWKPLGSLLGDLGGVLEAILDVLEASGGLLEASWAVLEASWRRSWASWRRLGGHDDPR